MYQKILYRMKFILFNTFLILLSDYYDVESFSLLSLLNRRVLHTTTTHPFPIKSRQIISVSQQQQLQSQRYHRQIKLRSFNDRSSSNDRKNEYLQINDLKEELQKYLELRKEVGADDVAKEQIGKVVGGTKGNPILEFVSVSPNKASITATPPNIFDYDELTKYGYGHLVTPIMKFGGRRIVYEMMNMDIPAIIPKVTKSAPKIIIDREGTKRYQGLKLNQVLDDNIQGEVLQNVQKKIDQGEIIRSDIWDEIESYEIPFADKRNVGPKQTPDWTVEQIDEWGKQQGRVESWARNAKLGAYVDDPMENMNDSISAIQRFYSMLTSFITAIAFGKATAQLINIIHRQGDNTIDDVLVLNVLQVSSIILLLGSLISCVYCGSQASNKNRSTFIWFMKGLLGGPFTIQQFQSVSTRITKQQELDLQRNNGNK